MTTYIAITNAQIDAESYIDTVLAAQWRDNLLAIQEGDATASSARIQNGALAGYPWDQAAIGASAIGSGEMKQTTGAVSVAVVSSSSGYTATFTGGSLAFREQVYKTGTFALTYDGTMYITLPGSYSAPKAKFSNGSTGTTQTGYYKENYIQSSPPYDLGNGDIPLFVFVLIDNATGDILKTSVSEDPPWANYGPTSIRPTYVDPKTKKKYRAVKKVIADYGNYAEAKKALNIRELYNRLIDDEYVDLEITQAVKQADMPLIPHPYLGDDLTGKTIVMLDPLGKLTSAIQPIIHDGGASEICEVLHEGHITIDNSDNGAKAPPGVMPVNCSFKQGILK